jgi:kynurenine formamidase
MFRTQTFTIGVVLAVALFLFAQHRPGTQSSQQFNNVVDLTDNAQAAIIDTPSRIVRNSWNPANLPAQRLIGPLVVLNVTSKAQRTGQYAVTPDDLDEWGHAHGQVPAGAIVVARSDATHNAAFAPDTAQFLVEARKVVALGTDGASVAAGRGSGAASEDRYNFERGVYHVEQLRNLDRAPVVGGIAIVAPTPDAHSSIAQARVLVLLKQ